MRKFWIQLRSSLWFVPSLLVLAALVLGLGFVQIDIRYSDQLKPLGWKPVLNAGAEGARGMLTAIASSMITVTGVAFSITIVTLSLASTQYTPRILRNFMRDRANQFVLGVFVGIYVYCLIVLRTIRGGENDFVPLLSVFFGVLLALVGIGFLIYFIHHIATSIQASHILDVITHETDDAIERLFPEQEDAPQTEDPPRPAMAVENWYPVPSLVTGYVQIVDGEELRGIAKDEETMIRIHRAAGDFVVEGAPLAYTARELRADDQKRIGARFAVGNFRTVDQDPGFGIRQIVDIAMKALSPGVNDTSTAVSCLHYLAAILSRLAGRRMDAPFRSDDEIRVVAPVPVFSDYVAKAIDEVRICAAGNVTILMEIHRLLEVVAGATRDGARRLVLLEQAQVTVELADSSVPASYDRGRINGQIDLLRKALGAGDRLPSLSLTTPLSLQRR